MPAAATSRHGRSFCSAGADRLRGESLLADMGATPMRGELDLGSSRPTAAGSPRSGEGDEPEHHDDCQGAEDELTVALERVVDRLGASDANCLARPGGLRSAGGAALVVVARRSGERAPTGASRS